MLSLIYTEYSSHTPYNKHFFVLHYVFILLKPTYLQVHYIGVNIYMYIYVCLFIYIC